MNKLLFKIGFAALIAFPSASSYAKITNSTAIISSVDSTISIWDGSSWSSGIPTSETEIIIQGELILEESLHVKKVTIESSGSLTILPGVSLMVTNEIVNNGSASQLIVENNANLIQVNQVENIGEITVKRSSEEMVRNDMTFWSSPVSGQNIRQFSPETLFNRFWRYNESNDEFYQILSSSSDESVFDKGIGYSIRVRNTLSSGNTTTHDGEFVGNPFNGDVLVPIYNTHNGYNLIGNPYSSDIDLEKFFSVNSHVKSIFIWNHRYPVGHENYNLNYDVITRAGSDNPKFDRLKVGQGFIVSVDDNNTTPVLFTNEMRIVEVTDTDRFWLELSSDNEIKNKISIVYLDNATSRIDQNLDRNLPATYQSAIYTVVDNAKLMIDARDPSFDINSTLQLGFRTNTEGNYTISLDAVKGLFSQGQEIFIKDNETETFHDLTLGDYTFRSGVGEYNNRFEVTFVESETLSLSPINQDKELKVYKAQNSFVIDSPVVVKSVDVYDIQGRIVNRQNDINLNKFDLNYNFKGVSILKITTIDGKIITKKITK